MPTMQVKRAEELRGEAAKLLADARKIKDEADKADRSITGEEWEKVNRLLDSSDAKKREAEMEERMAGLDAGITPEERGARLPEIVEDPDATPEEREAVERSTTSEYREAFFRYCRSGDDGLTWDDRQLLSEVRALTEGTDSDGGYLAPPQLVAGVEREALDLEQLAPRMNTINSTVRSIRQVRGEDAVQFSWIAELERKPESQPSFGRVQIDAHTAAVIVRVSDELLEDTTFDLEGYIAGLAAEAKVEGEEAAFVAGSGVGQPFGVLTRLNGETGAPHRYTTVPGGASELIMGDDFLRSLYSLRPRYRRQATWVLGTQAILSARMLKVGSDNRQYIWQPGLQAGQPDSILGKPVVEAVHEDVDNPIETGNDVGFVGDLRRYTVLRRLQLQVKRLEELYAETDEIGFRFRFRTGGDVQHTRAFRSLRIGAAAA